MCQELLKTDWYNHANQMKLVTDIEVFAIGDYLLYYPTIVDRVGLRKYNNQG